MSVDAGRYTFDGTRWVVAVMVDVLCRGVLSCARLIGALS